MPPRRRPKTIFVDFDGTLVEHIQGRSLSGPEDIGPPIPAMIARVRRAVDRGHAIVIFTARADPTREGWEAWTAAVKSWAEIHLGFAVHVTAIKSPYASEFWDDRAVRVGINTGKPGTLDGTLWSQLDE